MFRAHRALAVLATLVLGCPAEPSDVDGGPDGDGGEESDADIGESSLLFTFTSDPELPGEFEGDYAGTIIEATIALENIRAIGDAAPGDERTTRSELLLGFDEEATSNGLFFPDAPPGRYSHLLTQVVSYTITGTSVLDSAPIPFTIEDTPPSPLSVSIELEGVEVVDERAEARIEVDLEKVVKEIAWDEFDPFSESVEIDASSSMIDSIREHLEESFDHEDSPSDSND